LTIRSWPHKGIPVIKILGRLPWDLMNAAVRFLNMMVVSASICKHSALD
jgi:hypothetical protein